MSNSGEHDWEEDHRKGLLAELADTVTPQEQALNRYCHEGLDVGQCLDGGHAAHCDMDKCAGEGKWVAGICSLSATGDTRAEAVANLAKLVSARVDEHWELGC